MSPQDFASLACVAFSVTGEGLCALSRGQWGLALGALGVLPGRNPEPGTEVRPDGEADGGGRSGSPTPPPITLCRWDRGWLRSSAWVSQLVRGGV